MKTKCKKREKVRLPKGFKLVDDFLSKEEIEALENDTSMRDPMVITGGHESETLEESIARISRAIAEAKEEKKMYSIRLRSRRWNRSNARPPPWASPTRLM